MQDLSEREQFKSTNSSMWSNNNNFIVLTKVTNRKVISATAERLLKTNRKASQLPCQEDEDEDEDIGISNANKDKRQAKRKDTYIYKKRFSPSKNAPLQRCTRYANKPI